jgi:TolB-like protein
MTDELITRLAQISALHVISRTSAMPYKNVRKPLAAIASELNVDAVLRWNYWNERRFIPRLAIRFRMDAHHGADSAE